MEDAPITPETRTDRRSLAAIVFTDVVGFSRRAASDEPSTFAALHRDLALFTVICEEHGGRVANTAGDSMLLIFASAVDAMRCALSIQRELYEQSKALAPASILDHRIGVHIGDVIHDGNNAFGDGVNVASRIQEICRPRAIAYSRAVSEVVTGKVDMKGVYLGPRRAKNIGDPIPVWEIPPIADPAHARMQAELLAPLSSTPPEAGLSGGRGAAVIALAVLLLAVGFGMMATTWLAATPKRTVAGKPGKPPLRRDRPKNTETLNEGNDAQGDAGTNGAEGNATGSEGTNADDPALVARAEELRRQIETMKSRYDFDGIVTLLERARDEPVAASLGPATISPALDHYRLLSALKIWTEAEVRSIPVANPLDLGDGSTIDLSSGAPTIRGNDGRTTNLDLWGLSPSRLLGIMTALDTRLGRGSPPPAGALIEFASEYGLTAPSGL